MNETVTTIVGNVISDVKQRRITDGVRVVSFRVASNERRFDKASEQWVDGDRLFVSVTCWRKLARGVCASLVKGDPVIVTGRLFTRGYEVEGQKRSVTEMEAVAVGPDLSRCMAELDRRREATESAASHDDAASHEVAEHSDAVGTTGLNGSGSARLLSVPASPEQAASASAELVSVGSS